MASEAFNDERLVQAVLDDWHTAPVNEKLRATLGFLEKLTLSPGDVVPEDVVPVLAAGVSSQAIEDAIMVCTMFNIIDRVADSLGYEVPSPEMFARVAPRGLKRGYKMSGA